MMEPIIDSHSTGQAVGMTRQQLIAREWLVFLGCIIAGLFITYFVVYSGTAVFHGEHPVFMKYKNPGDMFSDLASSPFEGYGRYRRINRDVGVAWLLTISPYVASSFFRSILWAVRTLKTKPTDA